MFCNNPQCPDTENLKCLLKRAVHKQRAKNINELEMFWTEKWSKFIKHYKKELSVVILTGGVFTKIYNDGASIIFFPFDFKN